MEIDNNSAFWQIQINVKKEDAIEVEEFFMLSGAIGFYELLYEENVTHNLTNDNTNLFFFFELSFPLKAFSIMAEQILPIENGSYKIEKILFSEYVKMFEKYFQAFLLGSSTWLVPPWDIVNFDKSKHHFLLKPGLAFGTGKHITSQLMAKFIEENVIEDDIVFDLGCGSGILSLICALKGAKQITGVDVIKLAVESSLDNLSLNLEYFKNHSGYSFSNVHFYKGDFSFYKEIQYNSNTNVFLANILGKIFYSNAEHLKHYLTRCKKWALSGITEIQGEEFSNFLKKMEIRNFNIKIEEEWAIFYSA